MLFVLVLALSCEGTPWIFINYIHIVLISVCFCFVVTNKVKWGSNGFFYQPYQVNLTISLHNCEYVNQCRETKQQGTS